MDYYFFYPEGIKSNLLFNIREKKNSTVSIDNDEFEIVIQFCYLGDVVGQACGCADAVTARIGSAWKGFSRTFTYTNKQRYISCKSWLSA